MAIISPQAYCLLAGPDKGHGYGALPAQLVAMENAIATQDPVAASTLNRHLCRALLEQFTLTGSPWNLPEKFELLYEQQRRRIATNVIAKPDDYFSFANDPFRKDLAILRHRLIPCGAEFATPFSGISRTLLLAGGWRQGIKFIRVIVHCGGIKPFLELHMHPQCIDAFNPEGWLDTYENLADFLIANPSFLGVQSTSWFLDPALEQVSPHLSYLRRTPENCGAAILYAGDDDPQHSGAFATSKSRRVLYAAGHYRPRLFTRIWPRQRLLQRSWRGLPPDWDERRADSS